MGKMNVQVTLVFVVDHNVVDIFDDLVSVCVIGACCEFVLTQEPVYSC